MKNAVLFILLFMVSCNELDLNPLSQASTDNWYLNEDQIEKSINYLYLYKFWSDNPIPEEIGSRVWHDAWSDDVTNRSNLTDVTGGTINGQSSIVTYCWKVAYQGIANANVILSKLESDNGINKDKVNQYKALAYLARAYQYSKLIFYFGDVPFYTKELSMDEAYSTGRTDKSVILKQIYSDYDFAIQYLPESYASSELKYPTRGAALALKARTALWMNDWATVKDAAKACIDLGKYELYPDFYTLFRPSTKNANESIFIIPNSIALGQTINQWMVNECLTRIVGGTDYLSPSWDLFCSFLCKDGLPIDKSPLYNPQKPFENRDPRCTATIVEFQTRHLGFMYQPHPDSLTVLNFNTGKYQSNADSRGVGQYAAYNGLVWKKHMDDDCIDRTIEPDNIIIRYADVLLMYAEAKIELGDIDESVVNAINQVRARAYHADYKNISSYPAVKMNSQSEMRKEVRIERRMELAFEGRRYFDIIRWKLAGKVLNRPNYGMLDVAELRTKVVKTGLWFFPGTPMIDEDNVADFSSMYNNGLIKLLSKRIFDVNKQYLWPIPTSEILINSNLKQNTGY